MPRVLITGFGPFPGAPTNPTMRVARHLGCLRRERFRDVGRIVRLLPTTWAMLDDIAREAEALAPDVVLMFGLASRRRRITPEARALNRSSVLRADAGGGLPPGRCLTPGAPWARRGGIDAARMAAAMRRAGLPAEVSRDAGDYLCNGLFWRMAGTGLPCIFVHMPRPARTTIPKGRTKRPRPRMRDLEKAAVAALAFVVAGLRSSGPGLAADVA